MPLLISVKQIDHGGFIGYDSDDPNSMRYATDDVLDKGYWESKIPKVYFLISVEVEDKTYFAC